MYTDIRRLPGDYFLLAHEIGVHTEGLQEYLAIKKRLFTLYLYQDINGISLTLLNNIFNALSSLYLK